MTNPNPATPAPNAATPGSGEHSGSAPVATPAAPATPAPGNNNTGTVTIPVEQFAQLNRDAARARSFGSRVYKKPSQPVAANIDPSDPAAGAIAQANAAREEAERRAMQLEVRGRVRDLLGDERFKNIPQSTKDLILEQPHMLSNAESLDEAMYDIEDKLIDIASKSTPASSSNDGTPPANPATPPAPTRETPPVVTPGSPAPVDAGAMEDTSTLRGQNRSLATLRNTFKKAGVGVGPKGA